MNKFSVGNRKPGLKARLEAVEFKFNLSRLLMCCLTGIFLLFWAFFIGVLVGRGERPEAVVPRIADLMPCRNSSLDQSGAQTSPEPQKQEEQVMSPEELGFMGHLKSRPSKADLTKAPLATNIPAKPERRQAELPQVERHAPSRQASASGAKPAAGPGGKPGAAAADRAASGAGGVDADGSEAVFDYIYQVAASGDKTGADSLKNKLVANGLDAFVLEADKEGKPIYRINVRYRGTPDSTKQLSQKLASVGLNRKILITKQPVRASAD